MTLSLIGFRDYRATVRRLLAAGRDTRSIGDRAVIRAWLADEPPADLVRRFAHPGKAVRP